MPPSSRGRCLGRVIQLTMLAPVLKVHPARMAAALGRSMAHGDVCDVETVADASALFRALAREEGVDGYHNRAWRKRRGAP